MVIVIEICVQDNSWGVQTYSRPLISDASDLDPRSTPLCSVDIYYPTSILRPVYYYTVPSSARSGVRGTQRPANIVYSTVPY